MTHFERPHTSPEVPRSLSAVEKRALAELQGEFDATEDGDTDATARSEERDTRPTQRAARRNTRPAESAAGNEAATPPGASAPVSGKATLAFWNAMNTIFEKEAGMRAAPLSGITGANAGDFQNRRLAAGKYAVGALGKLSTTGVDPDVVSLRDRIAAWYAEGVTICEKGKFLLEKADARTRKGPEGKQWQDADKAHQDAVNAINASGEQVRTRMQDKHHLAFPALK